MSSINSMANPTLYVIFMPAFRRCVVKTFFPCLKNKIWPQETQNCKHNTNDNSIRNFEDMTSGICILFKRWPVTDLGNSSLVPGCCQLTIVLLFYNFLPNTAWKWKYFVTPRGVFSSLNCQYIGCQLFVIRMTNFNIATTWFAKKVFQMTFFLSEINDELWFKQ